jgi:hypothetical protein
MHDLMFSCLFRLLLLSLGTRTESGTILTNNIRLSVSLRDCHEQGDLPRAPFLPLPITCRIVLL